MIAPAVFDVRQEAKRVSREAPEMVRQAAFLRENQALVAQLKAQLIANAAKIIGNCDRINEWLRDTPPEDPLEAAALREETAEHRKEAFALMEEYNPERSWFWAEGRQAPERSGERMRASSRPLPIISDKDLDAAYARMASDPESEAEALEWIESSVGETLE